MARCDLHVHSIYSEHPSEWFLQRLGAGESYTDPEFVYQTAKARGMDYVTITDHNRIEGALLLKERYPDEVFTGVESTAYFPEDGCKIHLLIYGMDPGQFDEIQHLRTDVYELRDYLRQEDLAHSLAHATYAVNGRTTVDHLEKLVLLFDNFEAINGGRNRMNNLSWARVLDRLTPERLEDLYRKHRIEPWGPEPWVKGYTGGSDDHAGIFIAQTWTTAEASSTEEYLENLKQKRSFAQGRNNDFQGLVFTIYKVAYDFSRSKSSTLPNRLVSQLTEHIFERRAVPLGSRLKAKALKTVAGSDGLEGALLDLVEAVSDIPEHDIQGRLDLVYDRVATLSDTFFSSLLTSIRKDLGSGDVISLAQNVSSTLPGIFLTIPFFSSLRHLYKSRDLIDGMDERFGIDARREEGSRVLWFTDTLNDLNGVSVTLKRLGWLAHVKEKDLRIVTTLNGSSSDVELPPNVMDLPSIHAFDLPYYERYRLHVPSILKSLKMIYDFDPDRIVISTPGPMGLLGLLAAHLMNIPAAGVYHTDFSRQGADVASSESLGEALKGFSRWFYSSMDEVWVPTREYMDILEERGIDRTKMRIFRRGVDSSIFRRRETGRAYLEETYDLPEGFTLLYTGRISRDKNLDLLAMLYEKLRDEHGEVNLVLAGDGPYAQALRNRIKRDGRVVFAGQVPRSVLPAFYSGADLFVFPSTTDTFGMSVLEAQACGLPALVTAQGGPKELIQDGVTGHVLNHLRVEGWVERAEEYMRIRASDPERWERIQEACRDRVLTGYSWEHLLADLMDEPRPALPDEEGSLESAGTAGLAG